MEEARRTRNGETWKPAINLRASFPGPKTASEGAGKVSLRGAAQRRNIV